MTKHGRGWIGVAAMALLLAAGRSPAEEPTAASAVTPAEIAALIEQLGDGRYVAREAASARLSAIGIAAKSQLTRALESSDAEIRFRAGRILAVVLESDFARRLDAFANDVDGSRQITLPGWEKARQVLGDDRAARNLFVQMQRAEPELLEAYAAGPRPAATALIARNEAIQEEMRQAFQGQRTEPPLGSVAAMLLLAADATIDVNEQTGTQVTQLCYRQNFRTAMDDAAQRAMLGKLLGDWIDRERTNSFAANYQMVALAMHYGLRSGLKPAIEITSQQDSPPSYRLYAMLAIGRLGDETHLDVLAPQLNDAATCTHGRLGTQKVAIEVRDVALAVSLHLSGQKLNDYGYVHIEEHPQYLFSPQTLIFQDAAARTAALEKWHKWRAAQK